MNKNSRIQCIIFSLASFSIAGNVYGSDETDIVLCSSTEEIYFSCPLPQGKIVSVCGHKNNKPSEGYVQYRYGTPEKIEMIYPQSKIPPKDRFFIVEASEGSVNKDIIKFHNGRYTYIIAQAFVSYLTVLKDGKLISRKSCGEGGKAFLSRSARIGIETIPKSDEDFR
ncbi:hypothetical protein [Pseudomonas sp. NPDC086251]|uniref:hypothetical protein n=1 Tax=Pseudomonas sp. NPDC086251 TaxID=3364431 RepID=UPI0038396312